MITKDFFLYVSEDEFTNKIESEGADLLVNNVKIHVNNFDFNPMRLEMEEGEQRKMIEIANTFKLSWMDLVKILHPIWVCNRETNEMQLCFVKDEELDDYEFEWVDLPEILEQVKIYYKK